MTKLKHSRQGRLNAFFNARARVYANNPFVAYLFAQREAVALQGDNLAGAAILDVGCGTGRLYSCLKQCFPELPFRYLGVDPAAEALLVSPIPPDERRVGSIEVLRVDDGSFDRIYLLGVTTYLSQEVLVPLLFELEKRLSPQGKIIVQFTNADSLEVRIRQLLRPLLQHIFDGSRVASGDFGIYPRSINEVRQQFRSLRVVEERALPASVPFLQYLSPQLAVWLSKRLSGWAPGWLRMDLMVVLQADQ